MMSQGLVMNMNKRNQGKNKAKNFGDLENYLHAAECVHQHDIEA